MENMKLLSRCINYGDTIMSRLRVSSAGYTILLALLCLNAVVPPTSARPSKDIGRLAMTSSSHDWCDMTSSVTSSARLEELQKSLKTLVKSYDWEMVLRGLDAVYKITIDAWSFSDSILGHLVDAMNSDEEMITGMANVYLTYAPSTPEAVRLTDDNSVEKPTTEQGMAEHLQTVMIKQTENLARMLARLELLHQTEKDLGDRKLEQLMYGSMGETTLVLCAMQHLFETLSPGYDLPGRYTKNDLSAFEQDTLGTSHHIRMYAAYGVIQRHSDIIRMVQEDFETLSQQVQDHTTVLR